MTKTLSVPYLRSLVRGTARRQATYHDIIDTAHRADGWTVAYDETRKVVTMHDREGWAATLTFEDKNRLSLIKAEYRT